MRERIIKYIRERHCQEQGGFCFYRLEEPSGADTYYSLWVLNALNQPFHDERTTKYLEYLQYPNGSYESIFSAFYSIMGLRLLKRRPLYEPSKFILEKMGEYHLEAENIPAEITSIFKQLLFLMELYAYMGLKKNPTLEKNIKKIVFQFHNSDGGFGYKNSNLDETEKALEILKILGTETESKVLEFIKQCERPDYGFTDVPGTSLSYIEHINVGLKAAQLLSYKPQYLNACIMLISGCQRKNGGFSRSINDGIATIENTYYAVSSLLLISEYNIESRKGME